MVTPVATDGVLSDDAATKVAALIDSLPWLTRFRGATIVVKFGGNAMVDDDLCHAFAQDMAYLRFSGINPVVVHGGGPQISARLAELGLTSEFRGGYRVTTAETIGVVREVLSGTISRDIGERIDSHASNGQQLAVTISGEDNGLFLGRKRSAAVDGEIVDLGLVGDVVQVDPSSVIAAIAAGLIPVIASISPDIDDPSRSLNVNADSAAASLAVALGAQKLVILTDVAGLYGDWPNRDSLIPMITTEQLGALLPNLESGMIPKMTACFDAVTGGVPHAAIIDGRIPHSILLEIFTHNGIGTEVVPA
ncbi:MAG: acetylglutamate kinase [Microbacteriaceae bacterium]